MSSMGGGGGDTIQVTTTTRDLGWGKICWVVKLGIGGSLGQGSPRCLMGMVNAEWRAWTSYAALPHFIGKGRQIYMLYSVTVSIFIANKRIK